VDGGEVLPVAGHDKIAHRICAEYVPEVKIEFANGINNNNKEIVVGYDAIPKSRWKLVRSSLSLR
jgi:hypothetical protein